MKKEALAVFFWVAGAALAAARPAHAASDGGLPGSYLNYSGGPEVTGMGRAYVGLAEGIDAVPWNPAGLGFLRPNTIGFLHTQTAEQAMLDYIGYAQPIYKLGGVGLGYTRLDSGALPRTNDLNQEVGQFRDVQQTLMVGYGVKALPPLSIGGTFKYSAQNLSGVSAKSWGADLGFLAALPRGFRVGMRVQNLAAPSFKYASAADDFPRVATLGLAQRLFSERLVLSMDLDKSLDAPQSIQCRLGAEGTVWQVARLRVGFDFQQREFSFGLGYLWGRSSFDYSSGSNASGFLNRFGMTHSFGGYNLALRADPPAFSPMGLNKRTVFDSQVSHRKPIHDWILQIKNQDGNVVFSIRGSGIPPRRLTWDGKTEYGMVVAPGNYFCTLSVMDMDGRAETTPVQIVRIEYGTPLDSLELGTR